MSAAWRSAEWICDLSRRKCSFSWVRLYVLAVSCQRRCLNRPSRARPTNRNCDFHGRCHHSLSRPPSLTAHSLLPVHSRRSLVHNLSLAHVSPAHDFWRTRFPQLVVFATARCHRRTAPAVKPNTDFSLLWALLHNRREENSCYFMERFTTMFVSLSICLIDIWLPVYIGFSVVQMLRRRQRGQTTCSQQSSVNNAFHRDPVTWLIIRAI